MKRELVPVIQVDEIDGFKKRKVVWSIIKLFQDEGLSYQQAVDLLEDTKDQLNNIPINVINR